MNVLEAILIALSLCADCFAVSLCSSVTLKKIERRHLFLISFSFAIIQSLLLFIGWEFGNLLVGFVEKIAGAIGFTLLLYVGGSMIVEGIKNEEKVRDLNRFKNIIIGGIATSIDALAVGASQSMAGSDWHCFSSLLYSVFVITAMTVITGIVIGKILGCKFGRWIEIAGGSVLIGIGIIMFTL